MKNHTENPYVLVRVPVQSSGDGDALDDLLESLKAEPVDGVVLDLYRTSRLISRIHCPDEADDFDDRQLDRDEFLDLHERFDDGTFDVVGQLYDPELVEWYAEETETSFLQLHGGDITYKRLLESVASVSRDVVLTVKAAERSTVDRALEWLGDPEGVLLLHEEYESGESRTNRYRGLAEWDAPRGLGDPTGDPEITRSILAESPAVPRLWQPHLRTGPDEPGYTTESILELAGELKASESVTGDDSGDPEVDGTPWDLTDRDRTYQRTYRRSLMADRHLSAGSTLRPGMVRELRPGNGLPAGEIDTLDGILVQRPTEPQEMISY